MLVAEEIGIDAAKARSLAQKVFDISAFLYDHPAVSKKVADGKIQNARATGARLWATGCPSCRIQLAGNLADTDDITVVHPVQVVGEALRPAR